MIAPDGGVGAQRSGAGAPDPITSAEGTEGTAVHQRVQPDVVGVVEFARCAVVQVVGTRIRANTSDARGYAVQLVVQGRERRRLWCIRRDVRRIDVFERAGRRPPEDVAGFNTREAKASCRCRPDARCAVGALSRVTGRPAVISAAGSAVLPTSTSMPILMPRWMLFCMVGEFCSWRMNFGASFEHLTDFTHTPGAHFDTELLTPASAEFASASAEFSGYLSDLPTNLAGSCNTTASAEAPEPRGSGAFAICGSLRSPRTRAGSRPALSVPEL